MPESIERDYFYSKNLSPMVCMSWLHCAVFDQELGGILYTRHFPQYSDLQSCNKNK